MNGEPTLVDQALLPQEIIDRLASEDLVELHAILGVIGFLGSQFRTYPSKLRPTLVAQLNNIAAKLRAAEGGEVAALVFDAFVDGWESSLKSGR